jgi:hypothetical protein
LKSVNKHNAASTFSKDFYFFSISNIPFEASSALSHSSYCHVFINGPRISLNRDSSCGLNPVVEAADSGEDSWISELASSLATEADDSSLDLSGATGDCQGTLKGSKCFESSKVNQICALTSAVASAG